MITSIIQIKEIYEINKHGSTKSHVLATSKIRDMLL